MKPTRARLLAQLSFALATTLVAALPSLVATRAEAQTITQADRCREELATAARRYLDRVMKARIRCENKVVIGELPLATDCIEGLGDEKLERSLRRAEDRLSNIGSECNGVNLQLLGFPGVCPDDTGFPFDTIDYGVCVVDETNFIVRDLLEYYYPPFFERLRGNAAICLKGAPEDAAASLSRKIRAREGCLIGQDFGTVDEDVDCRAKILPYGPGTGDSKTDTQIARAYVALLGTIPIACADVQIDDLGYQADCPDATGGVFTVFDLKTCFFDANRVGTLEELAINFPTAGVCGDGNVSIGEECDLGVSGNSDTKPDTCRTDCTDPKCSDGVTDPGNSELCDDGNTVDLDCCTNACTLPVCGDGDVACDEECDEGALNANEADKCRASGKYACENPKCVDGIQDTGEECDDDNASECDDCSNICFDIFCGDNIKQSCRGEQCDDGVDNADAPDKCRTDCQVPVCGDGITDPSNGEDCDDGNSIDDDSCANSCALCGNGIKAPTEECDTDSSICPAGAGCNVGCDCEPACPSVGELVLFSGVGEPCVTNADCPVGTCSDDDNKCHTDTRLDTGWTGSGHNADINNGVTARGTLDCDSHGPTCGECTVTGVDPGPKTGPGPRTCRCANSSRTVCDQPFVADADDCGGAVCNCYFGAPFPLSAVGTPVCILNRFSAQISGVANVDLGAGQISARLRTQVFSGLAVNNPCPTCGGTCSNASTTFCDRDADCPVGGVCKLDPIPDDGLREGVCANYPGPDSGLSCDVMANNSSFPANPTGENGGSYSLDCAPFANISGAGLVINLTQTTGTVELEATLPCQGFGQDQYSCHCAVCSGPNPTFPCSSDAECANVERTCTLSTSQMSPILCDQDADCLNVNAGTCTAAGGVRCSGATSISCDDNADCNPLPSAGTCPESTCTSQGGSLGVATEPNACEDKLCTDTGGPVGECTIGPDSSYCGGVVTANGTGLISCIDDNDCDDNGFDARPCNITVRTTCFPDTITATGQPDPSEPLGAAVFCIPPATGNGGINTVAGLPGPGRVVNQAKARTFCENDPTKKKEYIPGVGGCIQQTGPLPTSQPSTGSMQAVGRRAVETETR